MRCPKICSEKSDLRCQLPCAARGVARQAWTWLLESAPSLPIVVFKLNPWGSAPGKTVTFFPIEEMETMRVGKAG